MSLYNFEPSCNSLIEFFFEDPQRNFCTLATSSIEERKIWTYQAKKLIFLCALILSECDHSCQESHQYVVLTSMAMRFVVSLTDLKGWKALNDVTLRDADTAVKDLVWYMCSEDSQLYMSIRRYLSKSDIPFSSKMKPTGHTDDRFLITVSAITLALRPFNSGNTNTNENGFKDLQFAAEQYCVLLLTIPWFTQRLPAMILSAVKHKSILSPCFKQILVRLVGKYAIIHLLAHLRRTYICEQLLKYYSEGYMAYYVYKPI